MPAGKDNSGLSPEIARLSALLARDPNSKLFMPLAEEYIKAGMVEEALMTLEEGLKANPLYMSARVLLGKAYMEKNDLDAARGQFEQVIKTVPDNLLAHRKLGEIYSAQGRREDAVRSYKMITLLSPKDEEAKRCLSELESGVFAAPAAPAESAVPADTETEHMPEAAYEEPQAPPQARDEVEAAPVFDLSGFEEPEPEEEAEASEEAVLEVAEPALSPATPNAAEVEPLPEDEEALCLVEDENAGEPEGFGAETAQYAEEEEPPVYTIPDEVPADEPELDWLRPAQSEPEGPQAASGADTEGRKNGYALDLSKAEGLEDIFGSYEQAAHEEEPARPEDVYEIEETPPFETNADDAVETSGESIQPEAGMFDAEKEPVREAREEKEPFETETLAELYIAQGFFDRAVSIYKNLILLDPQNLQLKQKLEELYQLERLKASRSAAAPAADIQEPEAEPLQSGVGDIGEDDGAGIVWEAEAEAVSEPMIFEEASAGDQSMERAGFDEAFEKGPQDIAPRATGPESYGPAAISRLERFLDNIRRKGRR